MSNSNVNMIISDFKKELDSIVSSKGKLEEEFRKDENAFIERHTFKNQEQLRLARRFEQQSKTFQTGINLEIDSEELADEIHRKIQEIIKEYPIEEMEWFRFFGTNMWHFKFNY